MKDRFNLERFVQAQDGVYEKALSELRHGRKESHWMWFIFPQIAGLGSSAVSRRYAISGAGEAAAYLTHSVLGPRLLEVSHAILRIQGRSAFDVFGSPDDMKLRSSMTLFSEVPNADPVFAQVLERFFEGESDPITRRLLEEEWRA